ncbi:MAG TPA: LCP family protein [Actinomycetales bacterium]|jgi:LCP family protein required for cell wall assembly
MHRSDGAPRHRAPGAGRAAARARHASERGEGFGRFIAVTVLALVPGAGLIAAGRRIVGWAVLGTTILALAAAAAYLLAGDVRNRLLALAQLAVQQSWLVAGIVAIVVVGLLWCLSVLFTAWVARPVRPTSAQRFGGVALVAALVAAIAAPSSVGVRYALIQHDILKSSVFSQGPDTSVPAGSVSAAAPDAGAPDPWAGTPRYNILLLGSDAGEDRTGVRPDSMIVASINTQTGDTVLFGVPRNLQDVPFSPSNPLHEIYPDGFNCGDRCLMNAVWEEAATSYPGLFPGVANPGLYATRDAISQVLGIPIDTYTIIDLDGFQSLVDAMGGVVVNVPRRIPIGGGETLSKRQLPIYGYIEPGTRRLDGYRALWFARSREGSTDYDRMDRQRCMVTALLDQSNPAKLLAQYPALARVAKNNIQTGIRTQDLSALVTLVERVQKGKITSLPLTNKVISTVDPDFDQIHTLVRNAIDPPPAKPKPSASPSATPQTTPTKEPVDTGAAQDSATVC